jgi:hypothetical protein
MTGNIFNWKIGKNWQDNEMKRKVIIIIIKSSSSKNRPSGAIAFHTELYQYPSGASLPFTAFYDLQGYS